MSKENNKKPPWWRFLARRDYNTTLKTAMMTMKELQARVLPKEIAEEWDFDIPSSWTEQPALYLLRGLGYGTRGLPPGSGFGLVQSPYADVYTKVYGVNPISDLPKYRKMYRSQPDIQQAIQMQVNLAIGKGFTISHESEEVIDFLNKMVQKLDLQQHMLVMATDCLVYGNSYTEIQWDKTVKTTTPMYEYKGLQYTQDDLNELNIPLKETKPAYVGEYMTEDGVKIYPQKRKFVATRMGRSDDAKTITALKSLDPLYMRVRRDSFGNQFGYIQWLAFPPVLIDNESLIHAKYRPMSWAYESAYGTSVLMPIIKNNELLMQFENDGASVAKDTELYYKINGEVYFGNIEELYNKIEGNEEFINSRYIKIPKDNIEVLSVENIHWQDKAKVKWKKVRQVVKHDIKKDTYKIETLTGKTIVVTGDHSLYIKYTSYNRVKSILKPVGEVTEDNSLFTTNILPIELSDLREVNGIKLNDDLLIYIGLWYADGNSSQGRYITISTGYETDVQDFVYGFVSNLSFAPDLSYNGNTKFENFNTYISPVGDLKIYSTMFFKELKQLGVEGVCENKQFPEWVHKLSNRQIGLFLKGYFSGDGSASIKKGKNLNLNISVYSISQKMLRQTSVLLSRLGITHSLKKERVYILREDSVDKFAEKIGFIQKDKQQKCLDIKHNHRYKEYEVIPRKIVKIEKIDYNDSFYDLSVEDTENFVANNFVCHNTWIHSRAVPPLIVKGGTAERPWSSAQMSDLMSALKTRTAATMIFTKGDVTMEEFKTMASDLRLDWWLDFLLLRRYQALGVPPIMMGYTYRTSRGIAEVVLHDFVTRLQVLQEFIADPIEEYIFKPLIKMKFGEDAENARIIWKPIIEEDKNMRSQRLIQMLQAGAVSVNEIREEMGFRSLQDPKYDELISKEPGTSPAGFPPKPGGEIKPPQGPEQNRVDERQKKPPESHMKLEDIKTKKIQLMKLEENFREKMLGLTQKTKFDLKDDAKLVKDIKREARASAKQLINENVVSSYLMGRMNANVALGNDDDLSLNHDDLEPLANLKMECIKNFDKILDEMVKMKENGELE